MEQQRIRGGDRTLWDKIWKDRQGQIVIWQFPNAWLIGWAVLTMVSLFTGGLVADVFSVAGSAALVIWSVLEITTGVNYFRRVFGLVILAFAIATLIKSF